MKKKSLLSRLLSKTPGAGEESSENREFVAEQLEARILYSAAPAEVEAPQVDQEVVVDDNSSVDFESADSFAEGEIPAVNSSASSGELVTLTSFDHLSSQEIESLANAAVERWKEADLTAEQIEALEAIEISMVDLEGFALGETEGTEIFLDWNAAGRDWFIDETPFDDDEFEFAESSTAFRDTDGDAQYGIDMLTVMMHEMGHVLGLEDIYQSAQDLNLMHWDLDEGQRITPVHGQAHGADPLSLEGVHQLNAVNPTGGDAAARGDALEADINTDLEAMLATGVFDNTTEGTSDPDYEINLDAGQTYAINQELLLANRTINVVINGNGATIDAQNLVRAFRIIDDSNVTINDLTIINGQHTSDGGGMWIDNSNVTLNNVTFQDNVVTADGNSQGAALYAQGHSTTITLSGTVNFIDNFAKGDGGAMAVGQHVVVDGSAATAINFTGNRSGWDGTTADPDEHGGAIWAFEHAQLTLNNATLDGNSASGNGGAIYISNSADIIFSADTSTSLQNNYAEDDGGGIYMTDASTVNLGVVDIKGNTAFLGNGGGFRTSHQENVVTITGGTLENNTAGISDNDGSGGGFWNQGTVNIKGVDIQYNLAYNSGGAFYNAYNNSVVNLEDVNILSNTAEDNAGGFRADDGTITFTNVLNTETKISGNRVGVDLDGTGAETAILNDKSGGGFYANRRSVVSIANGIIQDNTSSGHGAGFWASDESTVTITDGNILSNEIAPTIANNDERGGGFWVSGDATVNLDATDVTDNTAARQGGGFFVGGESATVNINDADISGNTGNNGLQSGVYGGGFYAEGSVNLTTVNITGNKVIGEGGEDNHGGGFATAGHGAVITGTDVNIIGNEAWTHGGGWYGADGTVNLTGGTISGNFVSGEGGTLTGDNNSNGVGAAAYLVGEGNAILNNVTVENHVSESHGGAFYVTNRHFLHLNGGVLQNNMAGIKDITDTVHGIGTVIVDGTDGGGFYATEDARVRIQGTTITGNVAEDEGGGFMIASDRTLLQIDSATIDKNTASSGSGGGFRNAGTVVFTGEGTVNITNNVTLQGNDATADNVGGGFYSSGGSSLMVTGTLDNGVTGTGRDLTNGTAKINITGNTAFGRGGGFYLSDGDIDLRGTAAGDINVSQNGISTNANVGGEKRGGGFWVSGGGRGANVRIDNGTIANNFTPNDGGGFYTRDGATVVLNETDILNNTAESLEINRGGGGFHADYSEDHIIITGGKIEGNVAGANNTANTRVRGGGFYTSGKVELHGGVQVLNNEVASSTTAGADRRGGGAALDNTGWIHATDATFDGNKSFNVGAGIYNEGKITATGTGLSVLNSSFTSTDQRREGAGVYFTGSSSADWDGGTIDGNVSTWHGGGVRITGSADVKFTNVTISNNKTVHHATDTDTNAIGGGIYASGPTQLTMIDSLVTSNTAEGRGGGFYIDDTTVTLVNTDVTNNYAGVTYDAATDTMNALLTANGNAVNREGGGFWLNNQANMTVTGGEISGNVAWQGGGLELRNDAKATFDGVTIQDNVAHNGGGFRSYEDAEIVFQNNSKIANNFSFNGNGGGFYIGTRVEVQLSDTIIDGNISEDHAGGIYAANDAKIFAERTTISNNLAGYEIDGITLGPDADRRGGAMWLSNNAEVHFIDSTISGNEAHEFGGAINMENDSVLSAVGSLFSDNIAGNYGGAIRYASNAQVDLTNTTVSGNYAGFNRAVNGNGSITVDENNRVGGGIWSQSDGNVGNFTHVTITDNYSTAGSGAGLYKSGAGTINIEGSIIFDNKGDADATPIASDTVNEMNLIGENIIGAHGGSALVGNTAGRSTVDPVLIALTDNGGPTETHAFVSGSSAENGAASSAAELDQRSGIRVDADLGAFELGATLPTVTVANVERLTHGPFGEIATFTVTVSASGTVPAVSVSGASSPTAVVTVDPDDDTLYHVSFTPAATGSHTVEISLGGPVLRSFSFDAGTASTVTDIDELHAAIAAFNSGSSDMTVTLAASLTAYDFSDATDGSILDLDVTNRDNTLVLIGDGATAADTVIDAAKLDRVFDVSSFSHLLLRNLTVKNGQVAGHGAGIQVNNAYLTLDNVIVEENVGDANGDANSNRVGAGMYITGHSVVHANNVTIEDNTTHGRGGGFYIDNTSEINFTGDTNISNNQTTRTTDAQAHGGGFWASGASKVNIEGNFDIADNVTTSAGGAFFATDAATVDGSNATTIDIIRNNQTNNHTTSQWAATGQGFWAYGNSDVKLANATVDSNGNTSIGQEGGGFRTSHFAEVEITNGAITNNLTRTNGAGFRASDSSSVTLTNVDISGNSAANNGSGGGFLSDAFTVVTLNGGSLEDNQANGSGDGAGFYTRGTVNITGVDIQNNSTGGGNDAFGGAFFATGSRADVNLTDVNILNNSSEDHGGGFWASDNAKVDFTLTGDGVTGNNTITISGNKIVDSGSRNGRGGGFWASAQAEVNINAGLVGQNVILNGNQTNQHGGAFSADGGHVTIVSGDKSEISGYDLSSVVHDGADSGVGAAFYVGTLGKVNITNVDIKNNTADTSGGGFFSSYSSEVSLTNVVISGNTANTQGHAEDNDNFRAGGGGFYSRGEVTLTNSTITNNVVETGAATLATRANKPFSGGGFWAENRFGKVILNDTDVTNNTAQGNGGGFAVSDAELVINTTGADLGDTDSLTQITGNKITADARYGGGFYAEGMARLTVSGANITGNSATNDGAGFMATADATVTVNNSAIHANEFGDPDGTKTVANRDGAGFYLTSRATVNLNNSELRDSTATSLGGGFRSEGADTTVNITNSKLHNNATLNNHGGAFAASGKVTITGSDFGTFAAGTHNQTGINASGNNNRVGGAIYQHGYGSHVTLNNTDISDQRAFGRGGAAYVANGMFTAIDSDFKDNQILASSRDGGALWFGSSAIANISNSEISGNSATGYGGGITIGDSNASNGATVNLDNVKLNNNIANSRGGGFWVSDTQSEVLITNSEINYNKNLTGPNTQRESGGGLYITHATVVIEDSTIAGNTASADATTTANREREGGGIRIDGSGANVTLTRTTVENNFGGEGAGIYNTGQLTLNDSLIRNNSSLIPGTTAMARVGGGIFSDSTAENVFNNSVIDGNTSTSSGGGMYNGGRSHTTLNNSTFSNNRTYDVNDNDNRVGGAMQITEDAKLIANQSLFDANEAHGRGGAIYNDGHAEFYDSTISNNRSLSDREDESRGGGIWTSHDEGNLIIARSSVVNNNSGSHGGGLWIHEGDITIQNTTISSNTAGVALSYYNDAGSGSYGGTGGALGGAIWADQRAQDGAYVNINNSTIAYNAATGSSGGIRTQNVSVFNIQNSIIYNNVQDIDSTNSNYDIGNRVTLVGDNIIGQQFGTAMNGNTGGRLTTDPNLSILRNNGGQLQGADGAIGDADSSHSATASPFLTHFLETDSSAIDAATTSDDLLDDTAGPLLVDNIGATRVAIGAAVDIGAIEVPDTSPPVAGDDMVTTSEDTILNVAARILFGNDTDTEDGADFATSVALITQVTGVAPVAVNGPTTIRTRNGATVIISPDGTYSYDPTASAILQELNTGESLVDKFTYTVRDSDGLTDEATVSITVTGVTDPPVVNLIDPVTTDEDTAIDVNVVTEEVVFQGELSPDYLADMNRGGWSVAIDDDLAIIGGNRGQQTEEVYIYRDNGGGSWILEATLTNPDGIGSFDTFGYSVTIDTANERAYIGARLDDDSGSNRGAVYFFENDGSGNWTSSQKLGFGDANDEMGFSVDVDSVTGTLVVGAPAEDTGGSNDSGAVYVFTYEGPLYNTTPVVLKATEGGAAIQADRFGESVAIDGNTIIAGHWRDDLNNGNDSGAAAIYAFDGTNWVLQTILEGNEAGGGIISSGERFGFDVDISGDTVVVGAYLEDTGGGDRGAVYVYHRDTMGDADVTNDTWSLLQVIDGNENAQVPGLSNSDQFGISVAIDATRMIVGGQGDDQTANSSGSAWIFNRVDTDSAFDLTNVQRLNASDAQESAEFGRQVAISGTNYLIGAHLHDAVAIANGDDLPLINYGRAYIYNGEVGVAGSEKILDLGASTFTEFSGQADFGFRVAVAGDIAVVGAPGGGKNATSSDAGAGQAYIYQRNDQGTDDVSDDTWSLLQTLRNLDDDSDDAFGVGVAVSKDGTTIAIGADTHEDGGSNQGAVYIFELEDGEYVHQGRIRAADRESNDRMGRSVALNEDGSVLAVGVFDDHSSGLADSGSVRVYDVIGSTWTEFFTNGSVEDPGDQDGETLLAPGGAESDEEFGRSVAISGNRIVVGEYLADDVPNNSGAAYVFEHNGTDWTTNVTTLPGTLYPATNDDRFGRSVDIDGDTIVVGSYQDEAGGGSNRGSATVFEWNGSAWVETALLEASDAASNDNFGLAVAVDGDHIVVGAYREDATATNAGAAYVYSRDSGGVWNELTKIDAPAGSAVNANFGRAVNISGGTVIIGAPEADILRASGINQVRLGAAYVYQITPISDAGIITVTDASVPADKGAVTANPDGTVTFDPRGDFDYLDEGDTEDVTVTYSLAGSEDPAATATGTFVVTVAGVNDTPIAIDDLLAVGEDDASGVIGNVLSNDVDLDDSSTLTITAVNDSGANIGTQIPTSGGGLATVAANGDVTFDPNGSYESLNAGQTAVETLTYEITDGLGLVVHSEKDGVIVGDAVNFTNTDDYISVDESDGVANTNGMAGSRTGTFMQIPQGTGSSGTITVEDTNRPRFLEYKVNIASAGTYQLFVRATGYDGGSDSLYASVVEHQDNVAGGNPDWYRFFVGGDTNFTWSGTGEVESTSGGAGTEVDMEFTLSAGVHTLRIMTREDGAAVDAFALRRSDSTVPLTEFTGDVAGPDDSRTGTVSVTVTGTNDAPTVTANIDQTVSYTEDDLSVPIGDIVISDVDSGDVVSANLTLADINAGVLTTGTFGAVTSSYDSGTGIWTATGSVADVNAALADVSFTPAANYDQNTSISVTVDDGDEDGSAALSGLISLNVTAVNDDPSNEGTLPGTVNANENQAEAIRFDAIDLADVDAGSGLLEVSFSVTNGVLEAISADGVDVLGSGGMNLALRGTLANLNAFVDTYDITYTGNPGINGTNADTIEVSVNDGGNSGAGGGNPVDLGDVQVDIFGASAVLSVTTQGDENGPIDIIYTVTLSETNTTGIAITFDLADAATGTATSGVDYTAIPANAQISVAAGQNTGTFVVNVLPDNLVEADETVVATISNSSNPAVSIDPGDATATANIIDDDVATVSITANDSSASEPGDNGQFTVNLTRASSTATQVSYTVTGSATEGGDFQTLSGTVTIAPNSTSAVIDVSVIEDALLEANETVTVTLVGVISDGDITVDGANNSDTVTIADDDLAVANLNVTRDGRESGEVAIELTVTLNKVNNTGAGITFDLDDLLTGSATSVSDYGAIPANAKITVLEGQSTGTFTLTVEDDATPEATETVVVEISGSSNTSVSIGNAQATANIIDNDVADIVYVDDDWASQADVTADGDLDDGTDGAQQSDPVSTGAFGVDSFQSISDALLYFSNNGIVSGKIVVNDGTYNETVSLPAGVILEITGPDTPQAVAVDNLSAAVGSDIVIEGSSTLTVNNSVDQTIAGTVSGSGGLVKSGTGELTLSGNNTFSGGTTQEDGTLVVGSSLALGTGIVTIEDVGVPVLRLTDGVNVANDFVISNVGGNKVITLDGAGAESAEISGNILINENAVSNFDVRTGDGDVITLSGDLSGVGRLSLLRQGPGDAGIVILSGNNTHAEGTELNLQSTVRVESATALGAKAILEQAVLEIADGVVVSASTPLEVSTTGNNKVLRLEDGATAGGYAGAITINEVDTLSHFDVITSNGQTLTLSGDIDGPGRLNVVRNGTADAGTVVLEGSNSMAEGTVIGVQATARVATNDGLGAKAILENGFLEIGEGVAASAPLEISTTGGNKIIQLAPGATSGEYAGAITVNEVDDLGHADVRTGSGQTLILSGNIDGPGRLTLTPVDGGSGDGGTVVMQGANSHDEGTFIAAAVTLQVESSTAPGDIVYLAGGNARLEVGNGVSVTTPLIVADNGALKTLALAGTATTGEYAGSITIEELGNTNFDVETATGQTLTLAGNIGVNAGGDSAIAKIGEGTVVMSGTNSYVGATDVEAGTLLINGDNSGATADVTVSSGATLGGNGTVGGSVTIEGDDGLLSPGDNGVGTLTLAGGISYSGNGDFLVDIDGTNDTNDRASITGNLDITSIDLTINEISAADDPFYIIATYTGTVTGAAFGSESGVPAGYALVVDTANNRILLDQYDAPVANDDTNNITETGGSTVTEGGIVSGNAMANDTDADLGDDPATHTGVDVTGVAAGTTAVVGNVGSTIPGTYGDLVMGSDGEYTYTLIDSRVDGLDDGDVRTDVFTYLIDDGEGGSDSATLTVTVNGTNDDPVAVDADAAATEAGGTANTGGVNPSGAVTMTDVDDTPTVIDISFTGTQFAGSTNPGGNVTGSTLIDGAYGTLTIEPGGNYSYSVVEAFADALTEGQVVHEVFTFTTGDGTGSDTGTIDITLTGANDATEIAPGAGDTVPNPLPVEQGTPAQLVEDVTVSDVDDTQLEVITVTISPVLDDLGDPVTLTDDIKDGSGNSLDRTDNPDGSITFTMTGPFTASEVKSEIEGLRYLSPNGSLEDRTVSIRVNDGDDFSSPIVKTIELSPQQNNFVGIQSLFRDLADRDDGRSEIFVGIGGPLFDSGSAFGLSSSTRSTTPFIAGVASPGSLVHIRYFDETGKTVTKVVRADQAGNFAGSVEGGHSVSVIVEQPVGQIGQMNVFLQGSFIFPDLDLRDESDEAILGMYFPLNIESAQALQDSLTPRIE